MERTSGIRHDQGVAQRIDRERSQMSAKMMKIVALLGEDPSAPVRYTITELAERAGTSPATVTRFCRALGFPGYVQLRVAVAREVGRGDVAESWSTDIGRAFHPEDEPEVIARSLLAEHTRALEATIAPESLASLVRVARAISECGHLDIYGVGGSGILAEELQSRLFRIGINGHFWTDAHNGLVSAVQQTDDSVAIGISNTGRTHETIEMLSQAAAAGAFTVAITHDTGSPLAREADVTLLTAAPGPYLQPDDFSVKHSQLMMIDLIYLLTAQLDFEGVATRLAATAMAVSGSRQTKRSTAGRRRAKAR